MVVASSASTLRSSRAAISRSPILLAKRAHKAGGGGELDYNEQVQAVVRYLGMQHALEAPENEESSFSEDILLGARLTQWSPAAGRTVQRSGLRDTGGM